MIAGTNADYGVVSVHHVGVLCENLERSLNFYQNILGTLFSYGCVCFTGGDET